LRQETQVGSGKISASAAVFVFRGGRERYDVNITSVASRTIFIADGSVTAHALPMIVVVGWSSQLVHRGNPDSRKGTARAQGTSTAQCPASL
jgi:hypothetical protein